MCSLHGRRRRGKRELGSGVTLRQSFRFVPFGFLFFFYLSLLGDPPFGLTWWARVSALNIVWFVWSFVSLISYFVSSRVSYIKKGPKHDMTDKRHML